MTDSSRSIYPSVCGSAVVDIIKYMPSIAFQNVPVNLVSLSEILTWIDPLIGINSRNKIFLLLQP